MRLNRADAVLFFAFSLVGIAVAQSSTAQPNLSFQPPGGLTNPGILEPGMHTPVPPPQTPPLTPKPPLRPIPIPLPGPPPRPPANPFEPTPPDLLRPDVSSRRDAPNGGITRSLGTPQK